MFRVLCIVPVALAAVSAVSGHVIRRQHKAAPSGWETSILQNYDEYHGRYLDWGCQKQHNTTYFDKCCHPLLNGEPISVLEGIGCGCEDDNSSAPPSSTTPTPSQPAHVETSSSVPPSSSSKPAHAALGKGNETPTPTPTPTPISTPPKSSTSPPPAQTSASASGGGGDVHKGGQATFFTQNGVAGACGKVHQDSDLICAMDSALFSQSICGKSVQITNTATGKSVTVVVADECPTCENANSIDLATGAFKMIGDASEGVLPIEWKFV